MTQTVQPHSLPKLDETNKKLTREKVEIEYDMSLLLSICEGLNNLSMSLNRLNNIQNRLCKRINRLDYELKNNEITQNVFIAKEK
jgi:hypothetical protein